jgi:hypothetical protein
MNCPYCEENCGGELSLCVTHFNCIGIIKNRTLFAVKGKFNRFNTSRVFEKRANTILGILEQQVEDTVLRKLLLNMDGSLLEAVSCMISTRADLNLALEAAEETTKRGTTNEEMYNTFAKLLMTASNLRKKLHYTECDVT